MATVTDLSGNLPDSLVNTVAGKDRHVGNKGEVHRSFPVVASDIVDLPHGVTTGLNVTTSGAYKVSYADDSTDTINLTAGLFHPINVKRVWAAGAASTAGIVAVY